jgi:hypothetical protein
VAELTPITKEVASLRVWEANAHQDADEAKEKLMALAEQARLDAAETKWLWKEQDELL